MEIVIWKAAKCLVFFCLSPATTVFDLPSFDFMKRCKKFRIIQYVNKSTENYWLEDTPKYFNDLSRPRKTNIISLRRITTTCASIIYWNCTPTHRCIHTRTYIHERSGFISDESAHWPCTYSLSWLLLFQQ